MIFADWSPMSRRLIAVSLGALSLVVVVNALVLPVTNAFSLQGSRISELEAQYVRFAQSATKKPRLAVQTSKLQADQRWRKLLIAAPSESEAAAALQNRVRQAAGTAKLELQSFQPMQGTAAYGFKRPGLRLELQGSSQALASFLETLRHGPELLTAEDVWVHSQSGKSDQLQVRMELYGYWAPPENAS